MNFIFEGENSILRMSAANESNIVFTTGRENSYLPVACVAGGIKGLGVYSGGNYGDRNKKDA